MDMRLYRNLLKCTVYDASAALYIPNWANHVNMHSLTLACMCESNLRKCDPTDPTNSKLVACFTRSLFDQEPRKILLFMCRINALRDLTFLTDRSSISQSRHIDCTCSLVQRQTYVLSHICRYA